VLNVDGGDMSVPILQFGTSRFLQAHVDLFVSEAMARGEALGDIAVVQTTASPRSAERVEALARDQSYPVRVRGLQDGMLIDELRWCHSIQAAWQAQSDWPRVRDAAVAAQVIVSNTGDQGYLLNGQDDASLLDQGLQVAASFPAKLLVLLHARWQLSPQTPLSLLPCELVARNGETLRNVVIGLAEDWVAPVSFINWLGEHCVWANSLVDRIVSEDLHPVGAVAEPYALWAIERQSGLVLPCRHPAIVLTDDLASFEQLKLYLLNLGHTCLAEGWQRSRRAPDETVAQAMNDPGLSSELEAVWAHEVLPVFDAMGRGAAARQYLEVVRDRLRNPFLAHRIADLAQNHALKKQRRFAPVVALADKLGLSLAQPRLRAALVDLPMQASE
jgi:tagaturonate reductase